MRHVILALFLALILVTPGLAQTDADNKVLELATVLEQRVAVLREKEFAKPVEKGIFTREQLLQYLLESLDKEFPPDEALAYEKSLEVLGFIPPEMNLRDTLVGFLALQIGGFYDPEQKILRCISTDFELLQHLVMVHEIEHALQDQSFDLERHTQLMEELGDKDEDMQRAILSVVEGDAQYVSDLYMSEHAGDVAAATKGASPKVYGRFALDQLLSLGAVPPFFTEAMTFPYTVGTVFVQAVREAGEWRAVDAAFELPPLSTEQVLHPSKYLDGSDPPLAVETADVSSSLGEGFQRVASNTLGEFGVRVYVQLVGSDTVRAMRASRGWGGDRYDVYEHAPTGRLVLVWLTTWDTEKDAQEFVDAVRTTLARRHTAAGESPETGERGGGFFVRTAKSLGFGERREKMVLVADGCNLDASLDQLAEAAWQGKVVGPKSLPVLKKEETEEAPQGEKGEEGGYWRE
ncbi:MAG: hypothetical protein AB1486_11090 [Planctomycetota bacterium]